MTVLFVMQHVNFFRNLDTVMRELHRRGHHLVVLHGTRLDDAALRERVEKKKADGKMVYLGRGLSAAQEAIPDVDVGYRPDPPEPWAETLMMGRQMFSRGIYMRPWHPSPERVTEPLENEMPPRMLRLVRSPLARKLLWRPWALRAWRAIEAVSPANPTVAEMYDQIKPDLVLVSPTIWPKNPVEADYIHAAKRLGIPTIGYVNSWDNLTSKGTVHVLPDVFVVWNEPLAEEAVSLHDVPPEAVRITGAPHLDHFFTFSPKTPRDVLVAEMGCPDARPYVVFLCSSRTLAPDETPLVTRIADAFARRFGDAAPTIVVRPHPTNAASWDGYERAGVVVHPKEGDQADTPEAWQAYFDQLAQAACVVGLNTTAFLEAVVADRPCLTIVSDEYYPSQGRTGHFRHLLKGRFLEVCATHDEIAERVDKIVNESADVQRDDRRKFVRWFLRPCGVDRPASAVVADLIESMMKPAPGGVESTTHEANALVPGLALASREALR